MRDPDACVAAVEYAASQFGRVDILVNGAAGNFLAEARSLTPKGFKTVMDIDAQGTYNMSHAVYPAMTKSGQGGSIINISMTLHYGGKWLIPSLLVVIRHDTKLAVFAWNLSPFMQHATFIFCSDVSFFIAVRCTQSQKITL